MEPLESVACVSIILFHGHQLTKLLYRHKDRSFSSSALTSMESWRFRRAMYRIMLFAELFPWSLYEEEYDEAEVDRIIIQHRKFLEDFTTPELQELYSAALFLVELNQQMLARTDSIGV